MSLPQGQLEFIINIVKSDNNYLQMYMAYKLFNSSGGLDSVFYFRDFTHNQESNFKPNADGTILAYTPTLILFSQVGLKNSAEGMSICKNTIYSNNPFNPIVVLPFTLSFKPSDASGVYFTALLKNCTSIINFSKI